MNPEQQVRQSASITPQSRQKAGVRAGQAGNFLGGVVSTANDVMNSIPPSVDLGLHTAIPAAGMMAGMLLPHMGQDIMGAEEAVRGAESMQPMLQKAQKYAKTLEGELPGRTYEPTVIDPTKVSFNSFDLKNITDPQIEKAKSDILAGRHNPIVMDPQGGIIDGNHRTMAARQLGVKLPAVIERMR